MQNLSDHEQPTAGGLTLNEDVSPEILDLYLKLTPGYLNDLNQAYGNKDIKSVRFHAHKLSSVMGLMGFTELHHLLLEVENSELEDEGLGNMLERISSAATQSLDFVAGYRS